MNFSNQKLFLLFSICLIFFVEKSHSQLTCLTIDQTLNNISNFASEYPNETIYVNGNYLNISYCVDVVNWPISNETFYNWSYYDQGNLFFTKKQKNLAKILIFQDFFVFFFSFFKSFIRNSYGKQEFLMISKPKKI